jgi:hypothetical protein
MLKTYPDTDVFAFPLGESRGTRGCMREAVERGHFVSVTEGNVVAEQQYRLTQDEYHKKHGHKGGRWVKD